MKKHGIYAALTPRLIAIAEAAKGAKSLADIGTDHAYVPVFMVSELGALRAIAADINKGPLERADENIKKYCLSDKISTRLSDFSVITSDNPRTEDPDKIIEEIVSGVNEGEYKVITNRKEAIEYALNMAKAGDIVLLAGKGHETYQILKSGKIHFDEREIVKEILSR